MRLADPATLALVRPGDRVDLFRVGGHEPPRAGGSAVARGVLVLEVTAPDDPAGGSLLVALDPAVAERAAAAPAGAGYAVVIRPE
ncbi:hypothetical protein [Krasilnikovia sp. MM14-A1259]|uniref:hypothetical protein n=1 Tax=Krasilnikovia sp. MM14-A1259 TaxID=3373539 RepID=UPI00399CEE16